jgi:two-component system, sensor histidine kinase PdtaS
VDAAVATPFAVVLTELVQNAIEHGLGDGPGLVTVTLRGGDGTPIELEVADDGSGPVAPADPQRSGGLGLRLVRALVEEELGGQFTLILRPGHGGLAVAAVPAGAGRA